MTPENPPAVLDGEPSPPMAGTVLPTGLTQLDRLTGGLQPGQVALVAGRPATGKTSLLRRLVEQAGVNDKRGVAVFLLEETTPKFLRGLLCSRAGVGLRRVREGFLDAADHPALSAASEDIADATIFFDDTTSDTVEELCQKARRMKAQHGISLVVVDDAQLLRYAAWPLNGSRTLIYPEVLRCLKRVARELDVPVVISGPLTQGPETREGGKPQLTDLRAGGDPCDVDVALLLHYKEHYASDSDGEALAGQVDVIVAKHPSGLLGTVHLKFDSKCVRFTEI